MPVNPRGLLLVLPLLTSITLPAISAAGAPANLRATFGKVPLQFEENRAQADQAVRFVAHGPAYSLYLTPRDAVLVLAKHSKKASDEPSEAVALRMSVVGARSTTAVAGVDELPGKANYFIGNDPSKWRTNVPTYAKVRYSDVYPGIDLVYYGQQQQLEYDFIVAPGADPGRIALGFDGANDLEIDAQGDLVLHTAAGGVRQRKPVVYQEIDGVRRAIEGGYQRKGTHVGFKVVEYDHSRPLVIDPVIVFSTLLPGSANGIAVDAAGNIYVSGLRGSSNASTTPGAFNAPNLEGGAFVMKLNSTGSLVYSAFIGGADNAAIAVDPAGNAYLTGATNETTFPTTPGALRTSWPAGGLRAAFVTKLNASGSALVYSTYLGGSGTTIQQSFGSGIAIDAAGNAYVAGGTTASDFPTTPGAFQTAKPTLSEFNPSAFVSKLDPTGSALVYSTYLGGSGRTQNGASGIAVDAAGEAFVVGSTDAADFPVTAGAFQTDPPTLQFELKSFITKLNSTGSALAYSTFFGPLGSANAIAVDALGNAYVVGETSSSDFPVTPGAFQLEYKGGGSDAIVAKLDASGSALVYSTFLGGTGGDEGKRIAIDIEGNAFVTGTTTSTDFPATQDACQPAFRGYVDTFVTMLDPTGSKIVYSTYIGGPEEDIPADIAVDTGGTAYVAGNTRPTVAHCPRFATSCADDFPTTPGALQTKFDGAYSDGFVVKVAEPVLPLASPPPTVPVTSSPAAPAATTQVADSGVTQSASGGGGAIDWLTLPGLVAALAFARRRRVDR